MGMQVTHQEWYTFSGMLLLTLPKGKEGWSFCDCVLSVYMSRFVALDE